MATSNKQEGGDLVAGWRAGNVLFLDLVDSYTWKLFIKVVFVLLTFQYVMFHIKNWFLNNMMQKDFNNIINRTKKKQVKKNIS